MSYAIVNIATGGIVGRIMGQFPDPVVWPNGDASHASSVGDERAGYRFVSVVYGPEKPGEFYTLTETTPSLSASVLTMAQTWTPNDLGSVQAILKTRIDDAAEAQRARYLTPGSGQALVYLQKFNEAKAVLNAGDGIANYPLLAASVTGTGTLMTTAQIVVAKMVQCYVGVAEIEATRISAKTAVSNAASVDEAAAVVSGLTWD